MMEDLEFYLGLDDLNDVFDTVMEEEVEEELVEEVEAALRRGRGQT